MKNSSNRTPPLFRGLIIVAGFLLLVWSGFHLWQWVKLRPLLAALDSFTTESTMERSLFIPSPSSPNKSPPKHGN